MIRHERNGLSGGMITKKQKQKKNKRLRFNHILSISSTNHYLSSIFNESTNIVIVISAAH